MRLKSEIDIAFALVRSAIDGTVPEVEHMDASQWWSLFRLMQQNHVAAMTADTVAALDVPREVKIPWLAERDKAERWHRYQREVQQEIVDTMARHGIETLVLKGTHTAQYYPQPELREFGDLDLFFYDKHDEADRMAEKELGVTVSDKSHHHTKYDYRGVTVESHYDFLNTHYPPSNRRYETLLKELTPSNSSPKLGEEHEVQWTSAVRAEECAPTFEVLFLLRHMACHFAASRITLRDLIDWALTCRALQDKIDWSLVEKTIHDYGMTEFVAALNTIVSQRLGIQISTNSQLSTLNSQLIERDLVYGDKACEESHVDGLPRLQWKLRRWRALAWKRRMVFSDSETRLLLASLTSHAEKPASILHKM